jgi:phage terminase Nu1 subunit (DNA packaging protein)
MANEKKATSGGKFPEVCSKTDLSVLLGVSVRTLTDLAATGILVAAPKKGTYLLRESVQNYVKKLQLAASNRAEEQRNPLNDEKLLTERVTRQIQEMKLAQIKGEVLSLEEVSESWTEFARKVKSTFLAIPTKLRQKLPHLNAADGDVMRKTVRRMLQDLAKEVEGSVIAADPADVKEK